MPNQPSVYSFSNFQSFVSNNFSLLVMALVIYIAGIVTGSVWTENAMLKSGRTITDAANDPTAPAQGITPEQLASFPTPDNDDHIQGNAEAKVVLIEYSDFECPFCAKFHPTMKKIKEEFGDQVAWGYRHFPLSFHPNAQKAGEASECVADQAGTEGFWVYADYVFAKNIELDGTITPEVITAGAEAAGVNMEEFQTCLDDGVMADKITADYGTGITGGINGTPGTVIITSDGPQEVIEGALPYEQVKAKIEKYL